MGDPISALPVCIARTRFQRGQDEQPRLSQQFQGRVQFNTKGRQRHRRDVTCKRYACLHCMRSHPTEENYALLQWSYRSIRTGRFDPRIKQLPPLYILFRKKKKNFKKNVSSINIVYTLGPYHGTDAHCAINATALSQNAYVVWRFVILARFTSDLPRVSFTSTQNWFNIIIFIVGYLKQHYSSLPSEAWH